MNLALHQQWEALRPGELEPFPGVTDTRGWIWCDVCRKWWHPDSEHAESLRNPFWR